MTPARFRWGMLLVLIGALLLLRNMDIIGGRFWEALVFYSPFLFIAIGIEKIFTGSRVQIISYLSTIALVAGAVYVSFLSTSEGRLNSMFRIGVSSYFDEKVFRAVPAEDEPLRSILVEMQLYDTHLEVRDASDDVLYARVGKYQVKPEFYYNVSGDEAHAIFSQTRNHVMGNVIKFELSDKGDEDWTVRFSRDIPLELRCAFEGSDIHLNLATTPLRKLEMRADASDVYLVIGTLQPEVYLDLTGDEALFKLRVPTGSGLKVTGVNDEVFLNHLGLRLEDNYFINDVYNDASNKINVELDDRISSLSIDYY
ncbi:MAG: DUF5668 domain-containing protein [candidate division Zixibacteria bacterium]|nr:DUF5668 domain-containing protein [candidate division Zixibacteria bacterium]